MYEEDFLNQRECSECGYLIDPRYDALYFINNEPLCEDCYTDKKEE